MTDMNSLREPIVCLYHADADGRCSAAIVRRALGPAVEMFEMQYGNPVPWGAVEKAGTTVIVDFSLSLEEMRRVQAASKLVWVDHHKTALEALSGPLQDVPGLRALDEAGCVLTWRTFFPGQPVPEAVTYIGDRDIWRFAHAETAPFGEGLYQEDNHPANDALWGPLLAERGDRARVEALIARGRVLRAARLKGIERQVARSGFEVTFEGHRTLAINARGSGDLGQYIREQGFELAYCYSEASQNGRLVTFVTLYSDRVDVSEIARRYGGGGHPGAAGFSFERGAAPFPPGAQTRA